MNATSTRAWRTLVRLGLSTLAAGVLLTNGCVFPHAIPARDFGTVTPAHYCPGDRVTAQYDLLGTTACVSRPGLDCATAAPLIRLSSTPETFPPREFNAFAGGLDFVPNADRVEVRFGTGSSSGDQTYFVPIVDRNGMPTTVQVRVRDTTRSTERIAVPDDETLTHQGVCAGGMPAHTPAPLPGLPAFSSNLRLQQLCNGQDTPIFVTITSASGLSANTMLGARACWPNPGPPGMPGAFGSGDIVDARAAAFDPTARCSAIEGGTPPMPIATIATMSCR
ncbi:MAG: hypothetical protein ACOY82_05050 [Pseudomonadota bacterium]